jgi:DNA repair protein RecO (recombination protein O)
MLVTVDGIVLARRNVGENSCFLDVLTDEFGVIEVMAHNVKSISNKNMSACSLFSYSTFCMNKNGLKYTLNSTQNKYNFHRLSASIESLSLAAYFSELLRFSSTPEQESRILRFVAISLYELERERADYAKIKAVFELRLAGYLGLSPDVYHCSVCSKDQITEMTLDLTEGVLICSDCIKQNAIISGNIFYLNEVLLYTVKYILNAPLEKIYTFQTNQSVIDNLSALSERYILTHLDRGFQSLDYYKSLL